MLPPAGSLEKQFKLAKEVKFILFYPNHKPVREYCQKHFLHSFNMEGFISTRAQKLLNICRYENKWMHRSPFQGS